MSAVNADNAPAGIVIVGAGHAGRSYAQALRGSDYSKPTINHNPITTLHPKLHINA